MPAPLQRLGLAALFLALAGCATPRSDDGGGGPEGEPGQRSQQARQEANPNVRFGMPGPAGRDPERDRERFLIDRPQYVLSYNAKPRTPNWVCWRLRKEDLGNVKRVVVEKAKAGEEITVATAREIVAQAQKKRRPRRQKPVLTDKLDLRLVRALERYRERWNPDDLSELGRHLREFAEALEKPERGSKKKARG